MRSTMATLLFALLASATAFGGHGMDEQRLEKLTRTLERYVENGELAGGVLHVMRRGEVVVEHAFGYRDLATRAPMSVDSLHRIASQTKAFTSVAIMMLQEDGRLLIGDPAGKYLPEYQSTTVAVADPDQPSGYRVEPARRPVTIRDLLTHTAGISYGDGPAVAAWQDAGIYGWYLAGDNEPLRDKVRRIAALPQAAQPGERFVYGYSTDILGAIIEVVSGETLGEFLSTRLFGPLGMSDTYFFLPSGTADRLATVYATSPEGLVAAPPADAPDNDFYHGQGHYLAGPRLSHSGGAGVVSTARDYATFLEMLRAGGTLNGVRVLGRKSVEQMIVDHLPDGIDTCQDNVFCLIGGFGLGFLVTKDLGASASPRSAGSYGWGGAYHSTYWVDPVEELTVVYLTQLLPAGSIDDHGKVEALVYQAIAD